MYKSSKVKAKRFSDDEISHQLKEIQDELDRLQIEGEERFKLNKLYSSNQKIEQSHSALHLVQNMQRFVHGLLSSKEFKETTIGEEVINIMKSDHSGAVNSSIANSLAEIVETATVKSKLDEDPETNIDFELALHTSNSDINFSNEF